MATPESIRAERARRGDREAPDIKSLIQAERERRSKRLPSGGDRVVEVLNETVGAFGGDLTRGLANTLGLPVDAVNFVFRLAGIPVSDAPLGGSESLKSLFFAPGDILFGERPPTGGVAGRIGEEVGAALAPLGPILRAGGRTAGVVSRAAESPTILNAIKQSGRAIIGEAARSPGRFSVLEIGLGAGGGVGAAAAQQLFPDSPVAETVGQIAGGLSVAGGVGAARKGIGLARETIEPFTKAGVERQTAEIIQRATPEPQEAARRIAEGAPDLPGAQFTSAQLSGDPGLLALERSIVRTEAELGARLKEAETSVFQASREGLQGSAEGSKALQDFLQGRVDGLIAAVDRRTAGALATARRTIEDATPAMDREQMNLVARKELTDALADAREQETALWRAIYKDRNVGTSPIKSAANAIKAGQKKASSPENVPDDIIGVIEKDFGDAESVDELLELRGRVLQAKRAEAAKEAPNRKLISNLDDLQVSVLDALGLIEGASTEDGAKQVRAALDFSRELNDRFTRGPIGKLLGFDASGGQKTPDLLTLERLILPGAQGGVSADALMSVIGGRESLLDVTEDFIRRKFLDQVTDAAGKVDPAAAGKFIDRHKTLLKRFPKLTNEVSDVFRAQNLADTFARSGEKAKRNILDVRRSRAALFLNVEPERAVTSVLRAKKPVAAMQELIRQAKKDPTGEAFEGLKQGFYETMIRSIELGALDQAGQPRLSARLMRQFTRNNQKVMDALYSDDELRRIRIVQNALNVAERSITSALPGGSDTAANVNILTDALARMIGGTVGARAGSAAGASSLITAGVTARLGRTLLRRVSEPQIRQLIERAVFEPDVMETLLMKPTADNAEKIQRRLHGHLLNLQLLEDED